MRPSHATPRTGRSQSARVPVAWCTRVVCAVFAGAVLSPCWQVTGEHPDLQRPTNVPLVEPVSAVRVARETLLYAADRDNASPLARLPAGSVVLVVRQPSRASQGAARNVDEEMQYVLFCDQHGSTYFGWVKSKDTVPLQQLGDATRTKAKSTEALHASEAQVLWEDPPALMRLHDAEQRWREIQAMIVAAERTGVELPEPYLARAELWASVHNHEEAMKDYLTAVRIALEKAPPNDVATTVRYFQTLYTAIGKYNSLPKAPAPGEAAHHYGLGVHAFRDGKLIYAWRRFSDAIYLDPQNPTYYYFRALTQLRLGDMQSAERDARVGSYYEHQMATRRRAEIDHALHFVQGQDRLWLERFRCGEPHFQPPRETILQ